MQPPWTLQIASDIHREGLGLELLDAQGDVVAEVFRCDADHTVTVRCFDANVPEAVLDELMKQAPKNLIAFEDGTPLPSWYAVEPVVEVGVRRSSSDDR